MKIILELNSFPNSNFLHLCLSQVLQVEIVWDIITANDASLKFIWLVNSAG